jgi:hypothetical protein
MARISAEKIKEREEFLQNLFKSEPQMPVEKANAALKEKFGSKMRPQRVYELRGGKGASNGSGKRGPGRPRGSGTKKGTEQRTAARVEKQGVAGRALVIQCSPEALVALESSIATLKGLGAQVDIDSAATSALNALRGTAQAA